MSSRPAAFVSSTCYDLAQIRKDLHAFLENIGFNSTMSEFNSFPVDPNLDAVGNCLARVKDNADIFILVVGGRYGSQTETGKSVTNLEYLQAKEKGIPRYVFVEKRINAMLPLWVKNRSVDTSGIVDSPKLFEFVESLRNPKENWVFEFECAQDIIDTLRHQLGYLFKDALDTRLMMARAGGPGTLQDLSGTALAIAVRRPVAWEIRLFGQVLADELARCSILKRDLQFGIALGTVLRLPDLETFLDFAQTRIAEMQSYVAALTQLVNDAFPHAMRPDGEPGCAEDIIYVAQRIGLVYRHLLEWTAQFMQVHADDAYRNVLAITRRMSQNVISELETFAKNLNRTIEEAVAKHESTGEAQHIAVKLTLTCADISDLDDELRKLGGRIGAD